MAKINEVVKYNLNHAQVRQKRYYDKFVKDSIKFQIGELVLLTNKRSKPGESRSFVDKAIGPFKIVGFFNDVNYRVESLDSGKLFNVHYNQLVKFKKRIEHVVNTNKNVETKPSLVESRPSCSVVVDENPIFEFNYFSILLGEKKT